METITTQGMEEVLNQIELADPQKHVGEINNVVFDGLGLVRKSVAQGIDSVIPYRQGKDYHQHCCNNNACQHLFFLPLLP